MSQIAINPVSRDRSWLILSGMLAVAAGLVYGSAIAGNHRDRLPAIHAATVASVVSAFASMFLIKQGLKRGPDAIAGTFVISWLLRSAISIGGCVLAIVAWHVSPAVTLLSMTVYYFATLAAETYIAVQRLKVSDLKVSSN